MIIEKALRLKRVIKNIYNNLEMKKRLDMCLKRIAEVRQTDQGSMVYR